MDNRDVGRYWESNARAWTTLSRQGWDLYRDALNTPAFLAPRSSPNDSGRLLPFVTRRTCTDA